MTFVFGKKSEAKLETCQEQLQFLARETIKVSPIDFGIIHGWKSDEEQMENFLKGVSKLDGVNNKSKHQSLPSKAFDIACYIDGKITWDEHYYAIVFGCMETIARQHNIPLRWGGTFNNKKHPKKFKGWDSGHFELI